MQINYTLAIMDNNTAFSCRSQLMAKSAVGFLLFLEVDFDGFRVKLAQVL